MKKLQRGIDHDLAVCHLCYQVNQWPQQHSHQLYCSRCHSPLHQRMPQSLARTWALVITSTILLVPANVYPVMTVIYFGKGQPDTIMSGVIHLLHAGMFPIALLVFVASVAVPVMKILGIIFLLLAVQFRWRLSPVQSTVMYRYIELIGRWSMLDLFMISILVTLVDLGKIATITAGAGSTAFAGVVVFTILAAMNFDPRLIWDLLEKQTTAAKTESEDQQRKGNHGNK